MLNITPKYELELYIFCKLHEFFSSDLKSLYIILILILKFSFQFLYISESKLLRQLRINNFDEMCILVVLDMLRLMKYP